MRSQNTGISSLRLVITILVASAGTTQAGVVMTQQTTVPDANGNTKTATYTTTIDGGRSKTVAPELTTIIDVEKATMVLLRPATKTYSEMPLSRFGSFMASGLTGEFKRTGKKRTIAGYACEEYRHEFKAYAEVSSLTCVSKDAPGAAEASAFYRRVADAVSDKGGKSRPEGVVLAEDSTVKGLVRDIAGVPPETLKKLKDEQANRPPIVTKIVVTGIKSEKVPADVWSIPKDYKNEAAPSAPKASPPPAAVPPDGVSPVGKPAAK